MAKPPAGVPGEPVLPESMEWCQVCEPGSYLHLSSGLVARVYAEDLEAGRSRHEHAGGGVVVRLDSNPGAPMTRLRTIAAQRGLRMTS